MPSFDVVSKIDFHELDNAVNSVLRELTNRYDFKGATFSIELQKKENKVLLSTEDEYKLGQLGDSLKVFCVKRGIDPKALDFQKAAAAGGNTIKQEVNLKNGIEQEVAKKITKKIKDLKLKAQASIRSDEVRIEAKKRDDLQSVISTLTECDFETPLQFINFRD